MPYETFDLYDTLQHLSPAAVEQCRSSPAAAFIREYKGECRFTPNPDCHQIDMDIAVGALMDQNKARSDVMVPIFFL